MIIPITKAIHKLKFQFFWRKGAEDVFRENLMPMRIFYRFEIGDLKTACNKR